MPAEPLLRGAALSAGLALLAGAGRVVAPLTVQHAVDAGLAAPAVRTAVLVGGAAVLVAGLASAWLNRRLHARFEDALAGLRRRGLRRVHEMAAGTAERMAGADLTARLTSDVDQTTTFLQGGGVQVLTGGAQLLVATAVMLVYSPPLAAPVLLLAALVLLVMLALQRVIARRYEQARRDLSGLQHAVTEAVLGAAVIRATGTAERSRALAGAAVDRARDSLVRTLAPLHANASLGEPAISTMTVTAMLGGVWWALAGGAGQPRLSAGQVVAMVFLVGFFVRPLQSLVQSLGEAQNARTGWRRAVELARTPIADAGDERGSVPLPAGPVSVCVQRVAAGYGDGPLVLRDVTFHLAAGEHVAVVGRTGSGKSTLAKLLTRRLEPAAGGIRLSGVPLRRLSAASLSGRVVLVPQDAFLFDGTVGQNLRVGAPDAGDDDALRVLRDLGLADWFATLPDGLATPVGLRGERLSVGERQLVALARTALADPDLVILDEATSGIDPATELAVQRALAALTRGRTTISIAHRISTAEQADRVLVLAAGRLVQAGPHARLAALPGPYADLLTAWTGART
ncbi:ABC transporter ATP-binding protein [Dactylosporangium sp. CS-047395]|uniref:ABC transporter ATP-binding protein n=1 Tax=Dactylosporangium sp. CS-047395 TaxID=3239936 RepID=UPI003D9026FE